MVVHLRWTMFPISNTPLIGHSLPKVQPRIHQAELVPRRQGIGLRRMARTQPSRPVSSWPSRQMCRSLGPWCTATVFVCFSFPEQQKPIQALLICAARWHHIDAHYTEPAGCKWPVTNDRSTPASQNWPHVLSRDVHDHAPSPLRGPITTGWIASTSSSNNNKAASLTRALQASRQQLTPYYCLPAPVWC